MFNLRAGNGEVILTSEAYHARSSAEAGIDSVRTNAANEANFKKRAGNDGQLYFVLLAANKQIISRSEMYSSEAARNNGIKSVMNNAVDAHVAIRSRAH